MIDEDELEEVFKGQIEVLKSQGYDQFVLEALNKQKAKVIKKVLSENPNVMYNPFFPVIPFSCIPFKEQLDIVQIKGLNFYSELDATKIANKIKVPSSPYYVFYSDRFDEVAHNKSPKTVENIFRERLRSPFTAEEIFAFCLQYNIFYWNLGMLAVGSYYRSINHIPGIFLFCSLTSQHPVPVFTWYSSNFYDDHYGVPSCATRACFLA